MRKLLPVMLILLVATVAFAQNRGRITGTVTTADGAVIPGVTVTIESDALIARSMTTTTNERGSYRFVLLPVGDFSIRFEKDGYKTIEESGIRLDFDETVTLDKQMVPSDFGETITITGEAPVVDKTSSSVGDKLDTEFLRNQANTRNVWAMPNLSAGFNDDSGLGGVQDAGNSYNIDGVNVSDPATSTVFADVNFEAVEQVDVNLFGANAEYGAFTGAALNVVTKSGGNDFSGEANYFGQRTDWVSDNTGEYDRIGTPEASDLNQFAGALGGPVVKDMVWFFGNINYTKEETDQNTLDGPIVQTEDPTRYFIKLSARWDDRNITFGSYTHYERFRSHRVYWPTGTSWSNNRESSLWSQDSDSDTFLIQHSLVASDELILEGKFAGFSGGFNLVPRNGDDAPLLWDYVNGEHLPGSNANRHDEITRDRNNLLLTANYYQDNFAGQHSFKAGFEYENSLNARFLSLTDFEYWAGPGNPVQKFDFGTRDGGTRIERFAGFVQDSWSVNDRLTLNLGVRYDRTSTKADDPANAPIGDETIFTFDDPAYRAGFAYDVFGDGKTVVRGFAGRYYESVVSGNTESFTTAVPPSRTYLWDGMDWALFSESGGSGNTFIDDDYNNQYTEGFTLGIEHELMANTAASATFIYKRDRDVLGGVNPDATWDVVEGYSFSNENGSYSGAYYANYNSQSRLILTNPEEGDNGVLDDLLRNYYGLVLEVNKRMSDNWSLKANYTYSRNTGTAGQSFGAIQGFTSFSNPNLWINADGRTPLERPHVFKVSGTYIAPFDVFISPAFTFQSGWPYALLHQPDPNDSNTALYIKPVDGEDRYEDQWNVDLRVEKAFMIQDRYRLGLILDVFNVFNDDAVDGYFSRYIESEDNFLVPSSVVPPRFYQVGVRLIF